MNILDDVYFAMLWIVLRCAWGLARLLAAMGLKRDACRLTSWVIEECKKVE
jgi:hypothetical protein